MKEEELIKKLESVELPNIEVPSHRRNLKRAQLQSEYFKKQPEVGILNSVKSKIVGRLVARRPVWQAVLVTTFVVTMILGLGLTATLLLRQAPSETQPEWMEYISDLEQKGAFYTSIAFDPSGNPALSSWDSSTQALAFASWNGISWDIETVDAGSGGSLAFDLSGNPAIAYRSYLVDVLKYASREGSTWVIQTVDIGQIQEISLNFESLDNPVISYTDISTNDVKYAYWNGSSWEIQVSGR